MWHWHMYSEWGWVFMLLFWGVILVLAFFAIRALIWFERSRDYENKAQRKGQNALEILKERYAKGEISREEYQSMRKDLGD